MTIAYKLLALCMTALCLAGRGDRAAPAERWELPAEDAPAWVQATRMEGALYGDLNLDGIGGADDAAYVCTCQFGDFLDGRRTVLFIHLGTGETMAQVLPIFGRHTLQAGPLFSRDRQALVLEVQVPGSNYGAANLFVYEVFPAGPDPAPTAVERLNTADGPLLSASGRELIAADSLTDGAALTALDGTSLQGLTVYAIGENGQWREVERTLRWSEEHWGPDDGWVLSEG